MAPAASARAAGGGGGYSGSGGGSSGNGGGGGGSFLDPSALVPSLVADINSGDGLVTITEQPAVVPEPASLLLLAPASAASRQSAGAARADRSRHHRRREYVHVSLPPASVEGRSHDQATTGSFQSSANSVALDDGCTSRCCKVYAARHGLTGARAVAIAIEQLIGDV